MPHPLLFDYSSITWWLCKLQR